MYKRDLIKSEIENLALVLAKILGLKQIGKVLEAEQTFNDTINKDFGLNPQLINSADTKQFLVWLNESTLPPEKLGSLSEFLYWKFTQDENPNKQLAIMLNAVYNKLIIEHKIVHLDQLQKQEHVKKYL